MPISNTCNALLPTCFGPSGGGGTSGGSNPPVVVINLPINLDTQLKFIARQAAADKDSCIELKLSGGLHSKYSITNTTNISLFNDGECKDAVAGTTKGLTVFAKVTAKAGFSKGSFTYRAQTDKQVSKTATNVEVNLVSKEVQNLLDLGATGGTSVAYYEAPSSLPTDVTFAGGKLSYKGGTATTDINTTTEDLATLPTKATFKPGLQDTVATPTQTITELLLTDKLGANFHPQSDTEVGTNAAPKTVITVDPTTLPVGVIYNAAGNKISVTSTANTFDVTFKPVTPSSTGSTVAFFDAGDKTLVVIPYNLPATAGDAPCLPLKFAGVNKDNSLAAFKLNDIGEDIKTFSDSDCKNPQAKGDMGGNTLFVKIQSFKEAINDTKGAFAGAPVSELKYTVETQKKTILFFDSKAIGSKKLGDTELKLSIPASSFSSCLPLQLPGTYYYADPQNDGLPTRSSLKYTFHSLKDKDSNTALKFDNNDKVKLYQDRACKTEYTSLPIFPVKDGGNIYVKQTGSEPIQAGEYQAEYSVKAVDISPEITAYDHQLIDITITA